MTTIPYTGIATLFAALAEADKSAPISITRNPPAPTNPRGAYNSDWSIWSYAFGQWRFHVIGGLSLDDVAEDLVEIILASDLMGAEVLISPPGTQEPAVI